MSVTARIGAFVADAGRRAPDEEVRAHTVRALVDWTGAAIAGWRSPTAALLVAALAEEIGHGRCALLGPDDAAPARTAALLNGTASHVLEMDDIYAPALYHPGCPTIAAALAACQAHGRSGADLLRAIAIGYEVGNRIGEAVQPSHYRFWHTTGTVGCFGAAAAAAVAGGLDADRTGHALAVAATLAAGLQQAFRSDSMMKPLHAGRAAEAGVFAAQVAAHGLVGEPAMLEGPAGFGAAMSEAVDWDRAVSALGEGWTITRMTFKDHACCGHAFAAIDGALALRDAIGPPERIRKVIVDSYSMAKDVAGIPAPRSPFEAKFSIAFGVTTALYHGRVRSDAFTAERLADPRLSALMPLVEVRASTEYDATYPAMRGATVSVTLDDGRVLRHEQPTRRGAPTCPMSDAELADKFLELAAPVTGDAQARYLLAYLGKIDRAPDAHIPLRAVDMEARR